MGLPRQNFQPNLKADIFAGLLILVWLNIFPARHYFNVIFQSLGLFTFITKTSVLIGVFWLITVSAPNLFNNFRFLPLSHKIFFSSSILFYIFYSATADNLSIISIFLFFNVRYLILFASPYISVSRFQLAVRVLTILVGGEFAFSFFAFNNHLIGLSDIWWFDIADYYKYRAAFNPDVLSSTGDFRHVNLVLRLDGFSGYIHISAGIMSVLTAYSWGMSESGRLSDKLWFVFCLFAVVITTSTSSILAVLLTFLTVTIIKNLGKSSLKMVFTIITISSLFLIIFYFTIGDFLFVRLQENLGNQTYIEAFLPNISGPVDLIRFLMGFNYLDDYNRESDLIRVLFTFGVIPTSFFFLSNLYMAFKVLKKKNFSPDDIWIRAVAAGVICGMFAFLHNTLSWNYGSLFFAFCGLLLNHHLETLNQSGSALLERQKNAGISTALS